ncbi:MAG: amino acid permease [Candidatus Delongbacteria bacterium]|nr:amino acid permease [Candidatus Delongbacteria bacterium]
MATAKKFGTFGGVFTPSILTILGVIMYMRLPWITGQAGLMMTIGIILVAHLISITTGLSVSSIATDKKVKAGGTYYMISRSLGLPIGGTLGLALFVGLSFSVSLYLIGFSESFLSYWGFPLNINTIRLTGTIVLIAVAGLTLISTSLAIKTQYLIMSAIVLSLISILIGNPNFQPPDPSVISSIPDSVPFIVLFGIFFPAVTGFEAGVSMSGDLRNPKRSIPYGTITAISIGLVTYLVLAWFFAGHVRSDLLVNDSQILLKISYIPVLVLAGIWGATLSSALGSILGAPRILQATAQDRIAPSFFGKGYGDSNEPRHALLLTFIIAEIGILIGELDIIARVVSMFFITTYGFLNLSCAIERWASSDFHPDFKVPGLVSLIGAAACFIVMIQLDLIAMIGAALILGALFLYLKSRELTLESGDTWEGIWASLIRTGLTRLGGRIRTARNWRPNIILFSGGLQTRPHLVEISRAIAGKLGIISSFDLVEDPDTDLLFSTPPADPISQSQTADQGLFTKQLRCKDIFEGIQSIARIYGFTGIEPNTVLMGWSDDADHSPKFIQLIHDLHKLDYNSIFLDFDKQSEFGHYQTIDLWWKGSGRNFSFALTILRFFKTDTMWKEARLRVIFISEQPADSLKIHRTIQQILQDYRIEAEIKIIHNTSDPKPIHEIISAESARTDLTIMGISGNADLNPAAYISKINQFVEHIGSVMLIHASSFFDELEIGPPAFHHPTTPPPLVPPLSLPSLPAVADPEMMSQWEKMDLDMTRIISSFHDDVLVPISEKYHLLFQSIIALISHDSRPDQNDDSSIRSSEPTDRLQKQLMDLMVVIDKMQTGINPEVIESCREAIGQFITMIDDSVHRQSNRLMVQDKTGQSETEINLFERLMMRFRKQISRLNGGFAFDKTLHPTLIDYYLSHRRKTNTAEILNRFGLQTLSVLSEIKLIIQEISTTLDRIAIPEISSSSDSILKLDLNPTDRLNQIQSLQADFRTFQQSLLNQLVYDWRKDLSEMIQLTNPLPGTHHPKPILSSKKSGQTSIDYLNHFPSLWNQNTHQILNSLKLNGLVAQLKIQLRAITRHMVSGFSDHLTRTLLEPLNRLELDLSHIESGGELSGFQFDAVDSLTQEALQRFENLFNAARELYEPLPEQIEIPSDEFYSIAEQGRFTECETVTIPFQRLAGHLIETDYIEPIRNWIDRNWKKMDELNAKIRQSVNQMNFTVLGDGNIVQQSVKPDPATILNLKPLRDRFNQIKNDGLELKTDFETCAQQSLIAATEPMSSYSILATADRLNQMIWNAGRDRVLNGLTKSQTMIRRSLQTSLGWLIRSKSRSILLANRQKSNPLQGITQVESIIEMVRSITPNPTVYSRIPYHYQNLFNGNSQISHEFRVAMNQEKMRAASAVNRYQSGYTGGLLVLGKRYSGKSTLSRIITHDHYSSESAIIIQPPQSNSARQEIFKRQIQRSFNHQGNLREWISSLPLHSAIIIEDLELWWERSPNGLEVIETIAGLIRDYSDRLLFIITADLHAFKLINSLYPLDHLFTAVIPCQPFNSESLQQAIMIRHTAGGMQFRIGQKSENEMNAITQARLFDDYFSRSGGRIGIALNAWLANIIEVDQSMIVMRNPVIPKIEVLDNLDDDQWVYLSQILLHRRITRETLIRIMKIPSSSGTAMIRSLIRCGTIIERSPGIYEINMTLEPFLTDRLNQKRILP